MKLAQVRKYALSLPGVTEEPHFDRTSFRVGGKIFVTARPAESHIHVFVPEEYREPALAMHPEQVSNCSGAARWLGCESNYPRICRRRCERPGEACLGIEGTQVGDFFAASSPWYEMKIRTNTDVKQVLRLVQLALTGITREK